MNIKIFTNQDDFVQSSIKFIEDLCISTIQNIQIGLSGGTTPAPVYKAMAESKKVCFSLIDFWQVDERYVDHNQPDSNYKMISDNLFINNEKPASFHFFDTSIPIDKSLHKYEEDLKQNLPNGFDLLIIGIGSDGHTASIFPHSKAVNDREHLVAHTTTKKYPGKDRLTITFPAIYNSKKVLILLSGKEKEDILGELTAGNKTPEEFPAKKLAKHHDVTIHALL